MKKILYIARSATDNSDSVRAYYTREEALETAQQYASHLTDREKLTHTVSLESYVLTTTDDYTGTAEDLYRDFCFEEDGITGSKDPATYESITWPTEEAK